MADIANDKKVIKKKDPDFPEYLDFDKLRREGIDYLGKLSGNIWTDHNVHDPGITILEVLCYALLDLGYRTNLPVNDIFARDPANASKDDNFLTSSQILTCNPLTITDFRKLLIDIEGVKNAWLEVATDFDVEELCKEDDTVVDEPGIILNRENFTAPSAVAPAPECCIEYLNGLYHVYIELEKNKEEEIKDDKQKALFVKKLKQALLSHRNICEDFIDIKFLCKWEIGVCAEIELEPDADPEKVYLDMMEQLRDFFSPSPRFYNLLQLTEKKKTIDEIFAGRPYNIKESHGFVDTEELEKLQLRKSIHVSDVYNVLFLIPGIRKVQRLRLRNCKAGIPSNLDQWVIKIPREYVPEFSIGCSGFQFNREGIPVSFDFAKYEAILAINFEHNGKILQTLPSDKFDTKIPDGYYRKDIDQWHSIQNEFPRVYGIGEGGLPAGASTLRKAQAMQLKGYLLFFDQLLANYLSQLKNIRSLFALNAPAKKEDKHTYFISTINSVPRIQDVLRLPISADSKTSNETGFLAFPVRKDEINTLIEQNQLEKLDIEKVRHYEFATAAERDIAVRQLQEDGVNELLTFSYVTKQDGCIFYYAFSSSDDYALIGRKYYTDDTAVRTATAGLLFAISVASNYRLYFAADRKKFSFNIELNVSTYPEYLRLIVEDESTYLQRRQSFLNHLLARFAEKFTDYALLSFEQFTGSDMAKNESRAKEFFLSNYAALSSNRGRGLNYREDGWKNDNVSGFENKFNALIGSGSLTRQTLCNFDVYKYDAKYIFKLSLAGKEFFKSKEKFESQEEAKQGIQKLIEALADPQSFSIERSQYEKKYSIRVLYDQRNEATFTNSYPERAIAKEVADRLQNMFSNERSDGNVFIASYKYSPVIGDHSGNTVRVYKERLSQEENARTVALNNINTAESWEQPAGDKIPIGTLYSEAANNENDFIDLQGFKIDVDNTIVGKPKDFTYEVLDRDHRFKFGSLNDFANEVDAKSNCYHLLILLTHIRNYQILQDHESGKWYIFITEGDNKQAIYTSPFSTWSLANDTKKEIREIVRGYQYHLRINSIPDTWQFNYFLGYEHGSVYTIRSETSYTAVEQGDEALKSFSENLAGAVAERQGNEWLIRSTGANSITGKLVDISPVTEEEHNNTGDKLNELLAIQNDIQSLLIDPQHREAILTNSIVVDEQSACQYVYQLVDKDGVYAFYRETDKNKRKIREFKRKAIRIRIEDYNFLELNVNADNTIERKDGKSSGYHYQFKTSNAIRKPGGGIPEKLVLFESVKRYESKVEAENAFVENYLSILQLGLNKENYGENKPISEDEVVIRPGETEAETESIVYIPRKTVEFLGNYTEQAIRELVKIVKSYPIRSVRKKQDCTEFNERFLPCNPQDCDDVKDDCSDNKEAPVYFFVLYDKITDKEHWQSQHYFDKVEATIQAFRFFLLLLKYEGNYFIDCDCTGSYKLFIREVLAESVNRYETPAMAWGEEGIRKFISIAQTKESFYAYPDEDCCYKFFVACKNIRAVHPCKYDTVERRDKAMEKLYRAADKTYLLETRNFCQLWVYNDNDPANNNFIWDEEGKKIAIVHSKIEYRGNSAVLSVHIEVINAILKCGLEVEGDNVYLSDAEKSIRFEIAPGSGIRTAGELKEKLLWLACYFPIIKKEIKQGSFTYCIEIRLPGFNTCEHCGEDYQKDKPWRTAGHELCTAAWIGECCYETCAEAIAIYDTIIPWIKNIQYYKPVFDCHCGPYGIALHNEASVCVHDPELHPHTGTGAIYSPANLPPIVARNPQCYPNPDVVCDAIERAKKLINREGLHLTEHILLRPHCKEDCDCMLKPCPNEFDGCELPYWRDNDKEDPCDTRDPVCFKPGHDPYSFIATVALPAWPANFKKKGNRELIENILQREAPAHVLLRILWLTPHDLCCFESHFKKWLVWMAYEKSCREDYTSCDFVNFLFRQEFECSDDIDVCDTCQTNAINPTSCVDTIKLEEEQQSKDNNECIPNWPDQVSNLFCWKNNCLDYKFIECGKTAVEERYIDTIIEATPAETTVDETPAEEITVSTAEAAGSTPVEVVEEAPAEDITVSTPEAAAIGTESAPVEEVVEEIPAEDVTVSTSEADIGTESTPDEAAVEEAPPEEVTVSTSESSIDAESRRKFIRARFASYKKYADEVVKISKGNKLAEKARRFLDSNTPAAEEFHKLTLELLKILGTKDEKKAGLTKKQAQGMIENITLFLLDKNCFNGKKAKALSEYKKTFDTLKKSKLKQAKIYQDWDPQAVKEHEPGIDLDEIKKLLVD